MNYAINHLEKELRRLSWLNKNRPNDYLTDNIKQLEKAINQLKREGNE